MDITLRCVTRATHAVCHDGLFEVQGNSLILAEDADEGATEET